MPSVSECKSFMFHNKQPVLIMTDDILFTQTQLCKDTALSTLHSSNNECACAYTVSVIAHVVQRILAAYTSEIRSVVCEVKDWTRRINMSELKMYNHLSGSNNRRDSLEQDLAEKLIRETPRTSSDGEQREISGVISGH